MEPQTDTTHTLTADELHSLMEGTQLMQQGQTLTADHMHDQMVHAGIYPSSGGSYSAATAPTVDPASLQAYAQSKVKEQYGEDPSQWNSLYTLINNESGWNPQAANPTSSARGLGQFLDTTGQEYGLGPDASKADPNAQVDAILKYIGGRYGSPSQALNFWQNIAPTQSAGGGSHWY
jgi:hypothetical protein